VKDVHPTPERRSPITIKEPSIEPKGNRHKSVERPDDVSPQVWDDFVSLRKAKKAALTATALNLIRNEAKQAGISLEDALSMCCMRGWQGFKAAWVGDSVQNARTDRQAGRPAETFRERDERRARERWEEITGRRSSAPIDITPCVPFLEIEQ
jgi:hypothetical protein